MNAVTPDIEARARGLRDELTLAEKLRMLSGSRDFYSMMLEPLAEPCHRKPAIAADVPRLDLDGVRFVDGPRGVAAGVTTCFPVPMARAATFDPALEERVGEAIGREARARGANLVGAPCINLLRHPAWGRAQETYGESSELLGTMGAAFIRGVQRHAMACVKHYACNSLENNRFAVDVKVAEETLDNVYLPHFARAVREGVACVMSAYNKVNGEWCGENRRLLTTILKERWGFDGFVVSDWVFGMRNGVKAINAGLDLEMPAPLFFGDRLARAVETGKVPLERVDDAVLRLIRQQLRFAGAATAAAPGGTGGAQHDGASGDPAEGAAAYGPDVVACAEHRALAREVATRAIVLLRNEQVGDAPVLPLTPARLRRLAVIGRLAAVPNTGDRGSSDVTAPYVVTPLQGLQAALKPLGVEVVYDDGSDPRRAAAVAGTADAAVVVVGYDWQDEGEYMGRLLPDGFLRLLPRPPLRLAGRIAAALIRLARGTDGLPGGGDRASLTLHEDEEDLLRAVATANAKTVAVLMCGGAVLMEKWRHQVPGILVLWYPGMEGGHALADIVLGVREPTGRLPFAIPTSEEHLPFFDRDAKVVEYGPLHGQALLDHLGVPAAYPFGAGLSYNG